MTSKDNKLSNKEAQRKINEIATLGDIIPAYHYYEKGKEIRNYSLQDVRYILKKGKVTDPPEYDEFHRDWEYNVEGKTIDGDEAIVVLAIISHRELKVITVKPK